MKKMLCAVLLMSLIILPAQSVFAHCGGCGIGGEAAEEEAPAKEGGCCNTSAEKSSTEDAHAGHDHHGHNH